MFLLSADAGEAPRRSDPTATAATPAALRLRVVLSLMSISASPLWRSPGFATGRCEDGLLVCRLSVLAGYGGGEVVSVGAEPGEFSRRPLWPPSKLRTTLVMGASGTVSKVVRRRPWTESTWPSRTIVDLAVEGGDDVGEPARPVARR